VTLLGGAFEGDQQAFDAARADPALTSADVMAFSCHPSAAWSLSSFSSFRRTSCPDELLADLDDLVLIRPKVGRPPSGT
jgi:hypothetical protein